METLVIEHQDEVVVLRLARPQRRNAINFRLLREFEEILTTVEQDESIRALVVTGNEQAFCAGQDLKEEEPPAFVQTINAVFDRLEALPVPTVAAIDGWCLAGGLELALTCDLRIASREARIGDRHAQIDSIGGAGATVRLTRLLGLCRAKELIFTAAVLEGEVAQRMGLVSYVYPRADLLDRAIEHARSMCVGNRITVALAKKAIHATMDLPLADAKTFSLVCQENLRTRLNQDYVQQFSQRGNDDSNNGKNP